MNMGKGFRMPQENGFIQPGDSWIPVTPEKPVTIQNAVILNGDHWIPVTPAKPIVRNDRPIHSGDLWSPLTPEKPLMRTSNPLANDMQRSLTQSMNWHEHLGLQARISAEKPVMQTVYPSGEVQGDQAGTWGDLLGLYREVLQEPPANEALHELIPPALSVHGQHNKRDGPAVRANGCYNQNSDWYMQNLMLDASGAENRQASDKHPLPSSYCAAGNQWAKYQYANSMLLQQKQTLSANPEFITSSVQTVPNDGIPINYSNVYNLNSPPRAESTMVSCVANSVQFAPATPNQGKQLENHQLSDTQDFSTDGSLRERKDKQELISTSSQGKDSLDELVGNVAVTPPATDSASLKGNNISGDSGHRDIDLNKTPLQRTTKRKKHRPKVVVEGKPKKTPKPTPSETKTPDQKPTGKRKYVRRKGLETSISTPESEILRVETPAPSSAAKSSSASKSCRRVLNFDSEDKVNDKSQDKTVADQQQANLKNTPFDLNLKFQDTNQNTVWTKEFSRIPDLSAARVRQQSGCNGEIRQGESICNLIGNNSKKLGEKSSPPVPRIVLTTVRDHTLDAISRSLNLQTAISCQNNNEFGFTQGHQPLNGEGLGKMPLRANSSVSNFYVAQPLASPSSVTTLKEIAEKKEQRGSKRDYLHTSQVMNPHSADLMLSKFLHHQTSRTIEQNDNSGQSGIDTLETNKRRKFEDTRHGFVSSMPSYVASVQDCSRHVEFKVSNNSHEGSSTSCKHGRPTNFNLRKESTIRKHNNGGNGILIDHGPAIATAGNGFENQNTLSVLECLRLLMMGENLHHNAEAHCLNVTTGTTDCSKVYPSQRVPATTPRNETRTSPTDLSLKRTIKPASSIQALQEKLHRKENKEHLGRKNSSVKAKETKHKQNYEVNIDEIIRRLEGLEITKSDKNLVEKKQNAIVPYKGDGKVVPHEGFDPIKRHRPRPKVDLDPETNRLWNLLMGKPGSENTETMDNDKEKWWEEERKVVRGRVDSFIARMHLVQGDRRFSQWKGSVVDSVIGVFLTQNVSDHLSSSAFMSLASKFPVQLSNSKTTCCKYGQIPWIEEPDDQTIDPDGTITYHGRKIIRPLNEQNSVTLSDSSEKTWEHLNSETVVHYSKENNSATEEEVVSSQNSSESFPQLTKYMRSSSDSEVEDHMMVYNSTANCILGSTPNTERYAIFQQYQSQVTADTSLDRSPMSSYQRQGNSAVFTGTHMINRGRNEGAYPLNSDALSLQGSLNLSSISCLNKTSDIGANGSYFSGFSEHKSMSSLYSTSAEVTNIESAAHTSKQMGGIRGSSSCSTTQESNVPVNLAIGIDQARSYNQSHKDKLQPRFEFVSSQESVNSTQMQMFKNFKPEGKSVIEPQRVDEADAKWQTGHVHTSSEQLSNTDTNIPNARKKKRNVDKLKEFDWDSLRKNVLSKVGKKERCPDNMDSLDYEALRHADVKTISDTIQERGMNNMLAERIKDFLNRIVREHGSIDLEWLRDVAGDEAKDYLLSIRGLGLKSVECVRLLTLHQIAFPVDTNVGRIAVRLGWVPLRPLPESLQLHLLELYPVLESIQKYLWPRLCKMDQRTLYELHYQLITFGKVFCTKRKPNCNACPMRAECRHFASAFASARLALPGPEERSMVNSTSPPVAPNEIPPPIVEPIPLLPAGTSIFDEAQYSSGKCEPIIEEPTTPEPSPEVPESDIEDLFYEDPDEIPTIKLNLEELTMNLQSVMRDQNMELQPGDLSRALVALDASTASIPVPKLKNVSRLRTEHQVYELPDSHPLLKGMERREPDDPSPYLLAIWGPGETADSTEPPPPCHYEYESNSQTVRGTLLIPCRTAMRGSFPLNGTYFQVNELFADHESSIIPIDVPRDWLWKLPRRTVYFGTSVTSIFRGLSTEGIQYCFWRGFVCVRGFDRKQRAPRPLQKRLHYPASKMAKPKNNNNNNKQQKAKGEKPNRLN